MNPCECCQDDAFERGACKDCPHLVENCNHCGEDGAPTIRAEGNGWFVECVECYKDSSPIMRTKEEAIAYWNGYQKGCNQDISLVNALSEQKSYNAEAVKRIDVLETALRKLTTVNRSEWVSGEWVAKVAEEALKGEGVK